MSIMGRDTWSGAKFASTVLQQGASGKWAVQQVLWDIDAFGHAFIALKTEGKASLVQFVVEMKRICPRSRSCREGSPGLHGQASGWKVLTGSPRSVGLMLFWPVFKGRSVY